MHRTLRTPLTLLGLLTTLTPTTAQLVNGGCVTGAIAARQERTYTFRANAGEGIQLRLTDTRTNGFYPRMVLLHPSGTQLAAGANHDVAAVGIAAPVTGNYRVVVSDGNSVPVAGSYRLCFTRAPGAGNGRALPNGSSVAGTITRGDLDSYSFAIRAGESYLLRLADLNATSLYPRLFLYDPQGRLVRSNGNHVVAALGGTAARTGTYTVVVADGNSHPAATGDYRLHYVRAPGANAGGALPNGGIKSGSITTGDIDSYTFSIVGGENYLLRLSDTNDTGLYPLLALYDPLGRFVRSNSNRTVAALGGAAAMTGTYTVVVLDGNSHPAATGDYNLHFVRTPGANAGRALPNGGSVAGRINLGELDSFTFAIRAGEGFQIRLSDTNAGGLYPRLSIYDPRGCFVASNGNHTVASLAGTAGFTGDYTVVVADGNSHPAATGDYRVHFVRAPGANAGGHLPNGGSVSGSIGLGELDSYSFALRAGESYILRVVDSMATTFYPRVSLYDPRGKFVATAANHTVTGLSGTAGFTGTYTLILADGNSHPAATGSYSIHYVKVPDANEGGHMLDGETAQNSLTLGDVDTYTFRGLAGERVTLTLTDTQAGSMWARVLLYDPTGRFAAVAANRTKAILSHTLGRDGTYTVVVLDGNSHPVGTGPYTLEIDGSGSVGDSGCSLEGTPVLSGPPSAKTGFAIAAPNFTRTCTGPSLIIFGPCTPQPILLPSSISCGRCGLAVPAIWGQGVGQVSVPPLASAFVGLSFCAQAGCPTAGCLTLSAGRQITIVP